MVGELPLGARDPLEGGSLCLGADGTVSGVGAVAWQSVGLGWWPDGVGCCPGSTSIQPVWWVA